MVQAFQIWHTTILAKLRTLQFCENLCGSPMDTLVYNKKWLKHHFVIFPHLFGVMIPVISRYSDIRSSFLWKKRYFSLAPVPPTGPCHLIFSIFLSREIRWAQRSKSSDLCCFGRFPTKLDTCQNQQSSPKKWANKNQIQEGDTTTCINMLFWVRYHPNRANNFGSQSQGSSSWTLYDFVTEKAWNWRFVSPHGLGLLEMLEKHQVFNRIPRPASHDWHQKSPEIPGSWRSWYQLERNAGRLFSASFLARDAFPLRVDLIRQPLWKIWPILGECLIKPSRKVKALVVHVQGVVMWNFINQHLNQVTRDRVKWIAHLLFHLFCNEQSLSPHGKCIFVCPC